MQPSKEETESTPETRPNGPPVQERPRLWQRLVGLYEAFRADLLSFDEHADGLVAGVDTFLKRHERKLHFLKPALLSFVGCLVFAGFDAFGGTHLLRHFTTEHVAALGQPYFVLGMFLLAIHLLFIAPDGKSIFGKWVTAPLRCCSSTRLHVCTSRSIKWSAFAVRAVPASPSLKRTRIVMALATQLKR